MERKKKTKKKKIKLDPPPINCTGTPVNGGLDVKYEWNLGVMNDLQYFKLIYRSLSTGKDFTSVFAVVQIKNLNEDWNNHSMYISTSVNSGGTDLSTQQTCNIVTLAPTKSPTNPPTYVIPTVPQCNVTVAAHGVSYTVTWAKANYGPGTPPATDIQNYAIYDTFNQIQLASNC